MEQISNIEHIRLRTGMYIGYPGDGKQRTDGLYSLLTHIIDNSVDEFIMGYGKTITIDIKDGKRVIIRDNGRGLPLSSVPEVFDGSYIGGICPERPKFNVTNVIIVNALSSDLMVSSFREGQRSWAHFRCGVLVDSGIENSEEENGMLVEFQPDETIFGDFTFNQDITRDIIAQYAYMNQNLALVLNGTKYEMKDGLLDMIKGMAASEYTENFIHYKDEYVEFAIADDIIPFDSRVYSFVNGHMTRSGGTHQDALIKAARAIRREFGKTKGSDGLRGFLGIINVNLPYPIFVDSMKNELGSRYLNEESPSKETKILPYIMRHVKEEMRKVYKAESEKNSDK